MSEATQARIFEPFFTANITGRGLGLAAVSEIAGGHEGAIQVESAVGKGSAFQSWFPGLKTRVHPEGEPAGPASEGGIGTVLIVDDEPGLRKLARAILEKRGYTVLVAENGGDAVEVFRQNCDTITAILLDMIMPLMGGEEAFALIRAIRADVPIVVSTGYSEAATRELFALGTAVGFVQKPYTAARLAERIRTTSEMQARTAIGAGR